MRQGTFVFIGMILVLLLSACDADTPAPTATLAEPTALLPTNSQVAYEPSYMAPPSSTTTPHLPSTATPTQILTATPIQPSPTAVLPTETPFIFPTPDMAYSPYPEDISPNGKWSAWRIPCNHKYWGCFQFTNQDGSKVWAFTAEDLDRGYDTDFSIAGFVAHWSVDNKFVYLVMRPDVWDTYFYPVNGLVKLSLVNGSNSYILTPTLYEGSSNPTLGSFLYYEFGFSDDSRLLAYAIKNGQSLDFTILDLYSGDTRYFSVIVAEGTKYGDITWSPNGEFFVFSAAENIIGRGDDSDDFSVFLVTLEDLSVKRILPHEGRSLNYPKWISNKEVRYIDYDQAGMSFFVILNIETGKITEVEND